MKEAMEVKDWLALKVFFCVDFRYVIRILVMCLRGKVGHSDD